jgi:hypothetical protein
MKASDSLPRTTGVTGNVVCMDEVDPQLVRAVRDGSYTVDPRAVAEAIMRRSERLREARRISRVLIAGEGRDGSVGAPDDEPGPRADVA